MILVINLGLKSIRAILYDINGRALGTESLPITTRLGIDTVEQSADEWKTKLDAVVKLTVDKCGASEKISYLTVSCSASCLVPIGKDFAPLTNVIMVSDKRASVEAQIINSCSEFKQLSLKFGYSATTYSQISRVLWFKNNLPSVYERTWKFLAPNDYLIMILTGGHCVTDILNAEKFFYDSENMSYPSNLLENFNLDASKFPDCVPIGTSLGKMPADIALALGIKVAPEVIVSTYDAICSVFGTGVVEDGKVCDVSGTVTSVRVFSSKKIGDNSNRINTQYFPPGDCYLLGGSNNLGGGLVEWAKQTFYSDIKDPYEHMQYECEQIKTTDKSALIFLPNILGTRAPTWNTDVRGLFFGLERYHRRPDMIYSIFESIAFSVRDFLEVFKEKDITPKSLTVSGGLARIQIANQLKATISGLPVHMMDEFESTSLGAAIIVFCSKNLYSNYHDACSEMVSIKQIFFPQKDSKQYYDDLYGLYTELYTSTKELFVRRMSLIEKYSSKNAEYVDNL